MISTTITINSISSLQSNLQSKKGPSSPNQHKLPSLHHFIYYSLHQTNQQHPKKTSSSNPPALILNLKSLFDMNIPVKKDYTRNLIIDRLHGNELQVGDTVYYLSHTSRYAIRKSTIVDMKEIPFSHHSRPFGGCELMLADSTVLEYYDVFDSKERALEYIVADLKSSLAHKRIGLQTILHEIAEDERLLTIFENKLP